MDSAKPSTSLLTNPKFNRLITPSGSTLEMTGVPHPCFQKCIWEPLVTRGGTKAKRALIDFRDFRRWHRAKPVNIPQAGCTDIEAASILRIIHIRGNHVENDLGQSLSDIQQPFKSLHACDSSDPSHSGNGGACPITECSWHVSNARHR